MTPEMSKGKFIAGKNMRTFRRLLQKKREFDTIGKGNKNIAFDFENVPRDPIRIRPEADDDTWLLSIFPPGPLHIFLIGKVLYKLKIRNILSRFQVQEMILFLH